MKHALFALLLSGCALLAPAKYDPLEFVSYAEIWQWAQRLEESCGDTRGEFRAVFGMRLALERLVLAARFGPDEGSRKLAVGMAGVVEAVRAGGSSAYCGEAAQNVRAAAERSMQAVGGRAR